MKKSIFVIGSSNVDRIMQLPHLPAVGETVSDGIFTQAFGGKGANQAVAAARAGGAVTFLNAVGADAEGTAMRDSFASDGIDTSLMIVAPDLASGAALVLFDTSGRNYLAVAPGANYALRPEHITANASLIRDAAYLILQMEIPDDTIRAALDLAQEADVPVLFNFAPVRTLAVPVSSAITGLVVNENEAEALTSIPVRDRESANRAAESLLVAGPSFVIVTLGADGAIALDKHGLREFIPAFRVTPVDTTAAGDTFCGALVVALVEGRGLLESCHFASAASALSVTKPGAQPSIPYRPEIDRFLADSNPL